MPTGTIFLCYADFSSKGTIISLLDLSSDARGMGTSAKPRELSSISLLSRSLQKSCTLGGDDYAMS